MEFIRLEKGKAVIAEKKNVEWTINVMKMVHFFCPNVCKAYLI